jgi:hypothetical protein
MTLFPKLKTKNTKETKNFKTAAVKPFKSNQIGLLASSRILRHDTRAEQSKST